MEQKGIIGIFDSGIGGLTVLSEIIKLLPNAPYIYFADEKNCPYGPKGQEEIIRLSSRIVDFLIDKGASLIVVACNTATAAAIDHLRANYTIPFVGMEPAIKPASIATKTKSIGVLATEGTFKGRLYQETTAKYATDINVFYQIGEGLVELIEQGKANSSEAKKLLTHYLKPMISKNIDHLVLGCSHYPFLIPTLQEILPREVKIVNPAPAVAKQAFNIYNSIGHRPKEDRIVEFYSSGSYTTLKSMVEHMQLEQKGYFKNPVFKENVLLPIRKPSS